jgi:hypothetical protein
MNILVTKSYSLLVLFSNYVFVVVFALQFPAKKLDHRLFNLGAKPIIEKGLGDDQQHLGYDFIIHRSMFISMLRRSQIPYFST